MEAASVSSSRVPATIRWLVPAPWVALVAGSIATLFLPGTDEDPPIRMTLVVTLAVFFLSIVLRLVLTAVVQPGRRTALLFLAAGIALWATGSATVSAGQTVTAVTFPAPGEVLCLAAYLGLAGFLLLDLPWRRATTLTIWLEAAVVCGAATCLAGLPLLTPLLGSFPRGGLALLLAVLFPLINLLLFAVVLAQAVLGLRERSLRTVGLLVGFLGLAVADSTFIFGLSADDAYTSSLVLDAVWGASFGIIAEAAGHPAASEVSRMPERRSGVTLVLAGLLAVGVLVLDPVGVVGWTIKVPAILTLVCVGARMLLALREARGAAEALRLSQTDELTGLPNRRSLLASTEEALQHDAPVAVMLLDLDGFKDINDSLGHGVGDEVLVALAQRMRASLPPEVTIARLGGDEFALLAPGEDTVRLFEIAEHVRSVLREPLRVEKIDVSIEASVGITLREERDASASELLRRADIAMYQAKQSRAGTLLFDASLDGYARERLRRGEALRHGIADGQIVVWYQPQVDARTGEVVAMEALVRWEHPQEGLLPPIAFLPDARRSGLMPAVTELVMHQVIADARRWDHDGFTFRVAMNCAPQELIGGQLLPRLFAALDDAHLPPDHLLIEVTEDSFLADPERARVALHQLRGHGIQVAIDDYGTGFSSLAYLRDLPVQELKIDRSFISALALDDRSRMIVRTTTQMAQALGMRLVAEGVEDAVAANELIPLGVDVLQGYHIAPPMPAADVAAWVRDWYALDRELSAGRP